MHVTVGDNAPELALAARASTVLTSSPAYYMLVVGLHPSSSLTSGTIGVPQPSGITSPAEELMGMFLQETLESEETHAAQGDNGNDGEENKEILETRISCGRHVLDAMIDRLELAMRHFERRGRLAGQLLERVPYC
jgi:hypothetical protein